MIARKLLYTVFRCGAGHKSTIGPDYLEQVGEYPKECGQCGDPWKEQAPVYSDEESPVDTGS